MRLALVLAALVCAPAFGKAKPKPAPPAKKDPRVVGLGRRCDKRIDCQGKSQVCMRPVDARGKPQPHGFCALPCASLESGLSKPATTKAAAKEPPGGARAAAPATATAPAAPAAGAPDAGPREPAASAPPPKTARTYKRVPPRCPSRFQCRSAGAGVPIDLCVRD